MDHFAYRDGRLVCDEAPAAELAERFGTPLYVYCARTIRHHFRVLRDAFAALDAPPLLCYSVKANSNLSLLRLLHGEGAGFDVVSGGELLRVRAAGGDPKKVVYAGVGKSTREIHEALAAGILLFNVEAETELERIDACARAQNAVAGVALRLNPDVDPKTHRYITTGKKENKFGINLDRAERVLRHAQELRGVECRGLHIHIGSQITDPKPYVEAIRRVLDYVASGAPGTERVRWLDIGGGFGVHYRSQEALPAAAFAQAIVPELAGRGLNVILEPGRFIMGNAGILLTRAVTVKRSGERRFVICDAGMNDLMRPALYQSYHRVWPAAGQAPPADQGARDGHGHVDVVGPICESGDFLGNDRDLPEVAEGDLLAVFSAGAYGMSMASNYNTRPRPAEVLVDGAEARLIRRRESYDDLLGPERECL
ncbi:MAG: diaminopimelate decarboxylase [Planctomycetes bacterium]|nr:diaminopimelate decarboxylase [Planctomycetota bacterium]